MKIDDLIISSEERTDQYKDQVKSVWNEHYDRNIWRTVHQAGSEEKNIQLAKHEMDLFLFPTKEKCIKLYENKEINPRPTFYPSFAEHKPITDYLPNLKDLLAVDYGCGSLIRYTVELAKHFQQVIGLDSSPKAIEYATKNHLYKRNNIKLMETDGISFPVNHPAFVFSNLVFQHIGNREILFKLINDIGTYMARGGVFRASFWSEPKEKDHKSAYHGNGFSIEDYKKVFEYAGFKIETLTYDDPVLWVTLVKK